MSDSLPPHGLSPARLLSPWDVLSKNTGVGCHFLLQGFFLTQGSNPCLLASFALAGIFLTTSATWEAKICVKKLKATFRSDFSKQIFFSFVKLGM